MNIYQIKYKNHVELKPGEEPIKDAPSVLLNNGLHCIPQHYLRYKHTRESIEHLVVDIEYWPGFIIFVDEDFGGVYLQVGIIGRDNYPSSSYRSTVGLSFKKDLPSNSNKVIYGRKWRVESELPTSEIIQTVFLALKTAREHEIRELFRLQHKGAITTPFNNHHDLPIMAKQLTSKSSLDVNIDLGRLNPESRLRILTQELTKFSYDSAIFKLCSNDENNPNIEQRSNGDWLLDIAVHVNSDTQLPELLTKSSSKMLSNSSRALSIQLTLLISHLTINNIYFQLINSLIDLSNQHVAQYFSYRGFHRFSNNNSLISIAELSIGLRQNKHWHQNIFSEELRKVNASVDENRVPKLHPGPLAQKVTQKLSEFEALQGFMPKECSLGKQ